MKTTYFFWLGNLLLAAIFTAYAYWEASSWIWMAVTILWTILWWMSLLLDNSFSPGIFFFGFVIVCLAGVFLGLRFILLFFGMIAALNAWDTDRFYRRWKDDLRQKANTKIELRHLFRLILVDTVSISVGIFGLSTKAQLSFGLMLLLVVIAMVSLSQLIRLLRSSF
jgi:hypothetical protein